jgi:uncharacterized protein (TIGR03067 family)
MCMLTLLLVCTGTGLAAQPPSQDAVQKELKLFQGTWTAVSLQGYDGKPESAEQVQSYSLVVEGDKFVIKDKGNIVLEGTFSVDPTKKIKTIDVYLLGSKDTVVLGIYQIDGDTRKSCFAELGVKQRPDGFRKEKGFLLVEWKRAK